MLLAETRSGRRFEFASLADYEASWLWAYSKWLYRNSGLPQTCFICGADEVDLHHRGYGHVGHEGLDELVPLCEDHHHEVERLVRSKDASRWDAHVVLAQRIELRADRDLRSMADVLAVVACDQYERAA